MRAQMLAGMLTAATLLGPVALSAQTIDRFVLVLGGRGGAIAVEIGGPERPCGPPPVVYGCTSPCGAGCCACCACAPRGCCGVCLRPSVAVLERTVVIREGGGRPEHAAGHRASQRTGRPEWNAGRGAHDCGRVWPPASGTAPGQREGAGQGRRGETWSHRPGSGGSSRGGHAQPGSGRTLMAHRGAAGW